MSNSPLNIAVIAGSVRQGRFADQAAAWAVAALNKQAGVSATVLDLADFQLPFFDAPVSPSYKQAPYEQPEVARFTAAIAAADAFVIVSPEYNHAPPAVLKNALDWVYQEWNRKPVAFVSYGTVGGARAVEQLRQIAVELQMAPVRHAVHIPGEDYFPVSFGQAAKEPMLAKMDGQLQALITDLLWWGRALKAGRAAA